MNDEVSKAVSNLLMVVDAVDSDCCCRRRETQGRRRGKPRHATMILNDEFWILDGGVHCKQVSEIVDYHHADKVTNLPGQLMLEELERTRINTACFVEKLPVDTMPEPAKAAYSSFQEQNVAKDEYETNFISTIVSPGEIGVKFDDMGSLEDVKKELNQ
ncbi:hypothetical protein ACFE04_031238 [Oxalis oulophora]